jgi:hypothetical protein
MEIFALPALLSDSILELFEAALQGFSFSTRSACCRLVPGDFVQILTNEAGQGRVAVHRDLPDPSHQVFWQRKRDIHVPILRETLIPCNSLCGTPANPILRFFFVFSVSPVLKLTISILRAETPRVNVSE